FEFGFRNSTFVGVGASIRPSLDCHALWVEHEGDERYEPAELYAAQRARRLDEAPIAATDLCGERGAR
ncbi:MAG: hypothetical protein AAF721_40290, partial [Myxococcota bacterium]